MAEEAVAHAFSLSFAPLPPQQENSFVVTLVNKPHRFVHLSSFRWQMAQGKVSLRVGTSHPPRHTLCLLALVSLSCCMRG